VTTKEHKEEEQKARSAAASKKEPTPIERLRGHTVDLGVPTVIGSFGFFWASVFGFILTAAGLCNGVALVLALSPSPSKRTLWAVLAFLLLGGACFLVSAILISMIVLDISAYYRLDILMEKVQFASLNSAGMLVEASPSTRATMFELQKKMFTNSTPAWIFFAAYELCFVYALVVEVQAIVCAVLALRAAPAPRADVYKPTGAAEMTSSDGGGLE